MKICSEYPIENESTSAVKEILRYYRRNRFDLNRTTAMGCINSKSDALGAQSGNQDGEQRVELVLRAKRQNVFTAGVDMSKTPVETKVIPKSDSQKHIICNLFFRLMHVLML